MEQISKQEIKIKKHMEEKHVWLSKLPFSQKVKFALASGKIMCGLKMKNIPVRGKYNNRKDGENL
jgi:hypothetical protein